MPIYNDYLYAVSSSSESDSDGEDQPELYDERDQEYWDIEALVSDRGPPPTIEYITKLGVVALYECATAPVRTDIESVVPLEYVKTWESYWSRAPEVILRNAFSHDEWDTMGCWVMQLCECCFERPTIKQIRSCMIRVLSHGKFIRPHAGRVVLPSVRRRH